MQINYLNYNCTYKGEHLFQITKLVSRSNLSSPGSSYILKDYGSESFAPDTEDSYHLGTYLGHNLEDLHDIGHSPDICDAIGPIKEPEHYSKSYRKRKLVVEDDVPE